MSAKIGAMERRRDERAAVVPSGGERPGVDIAAARVLDAAHDLRAVVLVEGLSDQVALETLAERRGRDLEDEGVVVVPMGGATSIGRFLEMLGPPGLDVRLAGLCDVAEEDHFRRALERAGVGATLTRVDLARLGFHVCVVDLEDELMRSLGADAVEQVVEAHGRIGSFRTYQKQPAHQGRPKDQQLRGFMSNWKITYARLLVEALDLDDVPPPLDGVLAHV
jgi:hypothetical protein